MGRRPGGAREAGPEGRGLSLARTGPLRRALERTVPERPFTVEFWDGTRVPATAGAGPTFRVRSPAAAAHALRAPGQLGLGRAYVAGEVEPDDLDATLELLDGWSPPPLDRRARAGLIAGAVAAAGVAPPPAVPEVELRPRGRRHSRARDVRAVRHHYDVSNAFFRLFLGPSMTYSCAVWSRGATTLEEAQEAKLELVCGKLALGAGDRLLDVGCGWGALAVHAAERHDARVVGITLSEPQAEGARALADERGVADRVDIRVVDYRDLRGERFDAVASVGMVEHVGAQRIDAYAETLAGVLGPGGRLLNHGIVRLRHGDPEAGPFSERYVFPDAAPLHVSRVLAALERVGFVTDHVEGLHGDYERTLRAWLGNLEGRLDEAEGLSGAERLRVWRLYLRVARRGFERGFLGTYQVRAHLT